MLTGHLGTLYALSSVKGCASAVCVTGMGPQAPGERRPHRGAVVDHPLPGRPEQPHTGRVGAARAVVLRAARDTRKRDRPRAQGHCSPPLLLRTAACPRSCAWRLMPCTPAVCAPRYGLPSTWASHDAFTHTLPRPAPPWVFPTSQHPLSRPGAVSYRRLLDQANALHTADGELLGMSPIRRAWHKAMRLVKENPRPRHEHGLEGLALDA